MKNSDVNALKAEKGVTGMQTPSDQTVHSDMLLPGLLSLTVFMNGFEAGGYQASLLNIGTGYQLEDRAMGIFASVQLIAGLIAPLIFGPVADRCGKKKIYGAFLLVQLLGCALLIMAGSAAAFLPGIFVIGMSVSALQYIALAALADAYPQTGKKKMGIITALYSLGAVTAPLICGLYLGHGLSWKILFMLLAVTTMMNLMTMCFTDFSARETAVQVQPRDGAGSSASAPDASAYFLPGVLLLCFIMFIYVGFENGFAFFINSYITRELGGTHAFLALSLFWLAMIPARILCGYFSRYNRHLLVAASAGVVLFVLLIAMSPSEFPVLILSIPLGFCSGAIYPCVLARSMDFAGSRTATVTGLITASTGLGGAVISVLTGSISQSAGIHTALCTLALLMAADVAAGVILTGFHRK